MKLILNALILVFAASANANPAVIQYLNCTGYSLQSGTTTIVFTGNVGGYAYLNITSVANFGFPFTQQARIDDVKLTVNKSLRFKLTTMLTNGTVYLEIFDKTNTGILGSSPGDDQIKLACTANIQKI